MAHITEILPQCRYVGKLSAAINHSNERVWCDVDGHEK